MAAGWQVGWQGAEAAQDQESPALTATGTAPGGR